MKDKSGEEEEEDTRSLLDREGSSGREETDGGALLCESPHHLLRSYHLAHYSVIAAVTSAAVVKQVCSLLLSVNPWLIQTRWQLAVETHLPSASSS